MKRLRTEFRIDNEVIEKLSIDSESNIKNDMAIRMGELIVKEFNVSRSNNKRTYISEFLIDLYAGEHSELNEINALLQRIIVYSKNDNNTLIARLATEVMIILNNDYKAT